MKNKKITEREYGKNYPYTKDSVTLKVARSYPNAIYIEDESGIKYAVNGNGYAYLEQVKKDKNFVGYTTEILKPGADDALILFEGFKIYAHEQFLKNLRLFCLVYFLLIGATGLSLYAAIVCKQLNWLAWLSFYYCFANLIAATVKCWKLWRGR